MLATVLSEIQLHGHSKSWSVADIQQQSKQFICYFNTIIAPGAAAAETVSEEATPESIMQASAQNWIPQLDESEGAENTELPYVLTNPVFQQFATLLTVFDFLQRPSPAPELPHVIQSRVFGYPESVVNKAMLKYFDGQVDSIASIAAAHFGISVPLQSATDDYSDFWAQVDLGLRRTKITFPPDSEWMRQSPAWPERDRDAAGQSLPIPVADNACSGGTPRGGTAVL
jgi:hypothetical protein